MKSNTDTIQHSTSHDFHARQLDSKLGCFTSIDPLAEKYYGISPYAYCAGDPVNCVDPDGKETRVAQNDNGTYTVIGGVLNNDRNIYIYLKDKDGNYTVRGESIGVTSSTTSFYNSDESKWAVGAIINPNNKSGISFLKKMASSKVTLDEYMDKARNGHSWDYKATDGGNFVIYKLIEEYYRGMPIGKDLSGKTIYTSARDIGNMGAGIVAAKNGIPWSAARIAFDAYQGGREGKSTQNAEYYGWSMYYYSRSNGLTEAIHLKNTINHFIMNLFQ